MYISKGIYILTGNDLYEVMNKAYRDAQNRNTFDFSGIIHEVLNKE